MNTHEELVHIDTELRVLTHQSVWLIRPDRYMRLPRHEGPRPPARSRALTDRIWHAHVGVWKVTDDIGTRYRILPSGRPPGAEGIYTGDIVAAG